MTFSDFLSSIEQFLPIAAMIIPGAQPFAPAIAALPSAINEVETLFGSDKTVTSATKATTAIALATNTMNAVSAVSKGGQKASTAEVAAVLKPLNDALVTQANAAQAAHIASAPGPENVSPAEQSE